MSGRAVAGGGGGCAGGGRLLMVLVLVLGLKGCRRKAVWWEGDVVVSMEEKLAEVEGGRKRGRFDEGSGGGVFAAVDVLAFMPAFPDSRRTGVNEEGGGMTARNVRGALNVGVAAALPPFKLFLSCPIEVGRGNPLSLFSLMPDPGVTSSRRRFGCAEVGVSCRRGAGAASFAEVSEV